jgi:hypothetical protein
MGERDRPSNEQELEGPWPGGNSPTRFRSSHFTGIASALTILIGTALSLNASQERPKGARVLAATNCSRAVTPGVEIRTEFLVWSRAFLCLTDRRYRRS